MNIESKEKQTTPENEGKEPTPHPNLLDVVKIDNHWAQVLLGGDHIRYLEDGSVEIINWDDYNYKPAEYKYHDNKTHQVIRVGDLAESGQINPEQLLKVHWDGETERKSPNIRNAVTVFGEYTKK